jgi:rod shape-determining protein MreD
MRWLRFAILIVVITVAQASALDPIAITSMNAKPDLHLIVMVFFALNGLPGTMQRQRRRVTDIDISEAIITSFAIGFAADIIAPTMGPRMISFGVLGSLLAQIHRAIAARRMFYQAIVIMAAGMMTGLIIWPLTIIQHQPQTSFAVLLATSIYSAIIGPLVFLPTAWWMRAKIAGSRRR